MALFSVNKPLDDFTVEKCVENFLQHNKITGRLFSIGVIIGYITNFIFPNLIIVSDEIEEGPIYKKIKLKRQLSAMRESPPTLHR